MSETNDHVMQADFEASGSIYPKVTADQIDALMNDVIYKTNVVDGTTTTLAVAVLPIGAVNFTLAIELTACVDPRNFNAEKGAMYAVEKAKTSARNKLWELEGYSLAKEIAGEL